jgi:S-disulfanyl-L-cysteine oxidoreductase SoxD
VWGNIPMPAQTLPLADAEAITEWLATGAKR